MNQPSHVGLRAIFTSFIVRSDGSNRYLASLTRANRPARIVRAAMFHRPFQS
jgi:hypothetical protein